VTTFTCVAAQCTSLQFRSPDRCVRCEMRTGRGCCTALASRQAPGPAMRHDPNRAHYMPVTKCRVCRWRDAPSAVALANIHRSEAINCATQCSRHHSARKFLNDPSFGKQSVAKTLVRFTPESGHLQRNSVCPFCANSGHSCFNRIVCYKPSTMNDRDFVAFMRIATVCFIFS
jgi:hypothetical protein